MPQALTARNALVEQYQRLVWRISVDLWQSKPIVRRLGTIDDVVSVGQLGLLRAAELYNPRHASQAKFMTYACHCLRRYIVARAVEAGLIHVPNYLQDENAMRRREPTQRLERLLHDARVARACGRLSPTVRVAAPARPAALSDWGPLRQALATLTERDRYIVERRFGLDGHDRETLLDIGRQLGITREAVRQACAKALRRLREQLPADYDG